MTLLKTISLFFLHGNETIQRVTHEKKKHFIVNVLEQLNEPAKRTIGIDSYKVAERHELWLSVAYSVTFPFV